MAESKKSHGQLFYLAALDFFPYLLPANLAYPFPCYLSIISYKILPLFSRITSTQWAGTACVELMDILLELLSCEKLVSASGKLRIRQESQSKGISLK